MLVEVTVPDDEVAMRRLEEVAQALQGGELPRTLPVRVLLSWFGAERRGSEIVRRIEEALEKLNLKTEPDFRDVYIDSDVRLVHPQEPPPVAPTTSNVQQDATLRVGMLPTANLGALKKELVFIKPGATLLSAITLMMNRDIAHLPVLQNEYTAKGIVTWRAVARHLSFGGQTTDPVDKVLKPAAEVRANEALISRIEDIVRNEAVLVRDDKNRITGIITTSDLSLEFKERSEPFLLLGEIENHVRRILERAHFDVDELRQFRASGDEREVNALSDLTWGEYIRILEKPEHWTRANMAIDRVHLCKELEEVRRIRNDIMHFEPDGPSPQELAVLRRCTRFFQELREAGAF